MQYCEEDKIGAVWDHDLNTIFARRFGILAFIEIQSRGWNYHIYLRMRYCH